MFDFAVSATSCCALLCRVVLLCALRPLPLALVGGEGSVDISNSDRYCIIPFGTMGPNKANVTKPGNVQESGIISSIGLLSHSAEGSSSSFSSASDGYGASPSSYCNLLFVPGLERRANIFFLT